MPALKFEFTNASGQSLAGRLEAPPDNRPIAAYPLFAHCFTCGFSIGSPTISADCLQKAFSFLICRSISKSLQKVLNAICRSIL